MKFIVKYVMLVNYKFHNFIAIIAKMVDFNWYNKKSDIVLNY